MTFIPISSSKKIKTEGPKDKGQVKNQEALKKVAELQEGGPWWSKWWSGLKKCCERPDKRTLKPLRLSVRKVSRIK